MPSSKADQRWQLEAESNLMDTTILLPFNIERSQDAGREFGGLDEASCYRRRTAVTSKVHDRLENQE
jgi:hypothetical protein